MKNKKQFIVVREINMFGEVSVEYKPTVFLATDSYPINELRVMEYMNTNNPIIRPVSRWYLPMTEPMLATYINTNIEVNKEPDTIESLNSLIEELDGLYDSLKRGPLKQVLFTEVDKPNGELTFTNIVDSEALECARIEIMSYIDELKQKRNKLDNDRERLEIKELIKTMSTNELLDILGGSK